MEYTNESSTEIDERRKNVAEVMLAFINIIFNLSSDGGFELVKRHGVFSLIGHTAARKSVYWNDLVTALGGVFAFCRTPMALKDVFKFIFIGIMEQIEHNLKIAKDTQLINPQLLLESAYMSQHVYGEHHLLINGWEEVKYGEFRSLNYQDETGFLSNIYARETSSGMEYVYATAGTNAKNSEDWRNNIYQICGESEQYAHALKTALAIDSIVKRKGGTLTFVGHSLGGGEAINHLLNTQGNHAIVFNPAGLSDLTIKANKIDKDTAALSVIMPTDPLNIVQDILSSKSYFKGIVPFTRGKRLYLNSNMEFSHGVSDIISYLETIIQPNTVSYHKR